MKNNRWKVKSLHDVLNGAMLSNGSHQIRQFYQERRAPTGKGVLLTSNGYVLSAAHVVKGQVRWGDYEIDQRSSELLEEHDLALVKVDMGNSWGVALEKLARRTPACASIVQIPDGQDVLSGFITATDYTNQGNSMIDCVETSIEGTYGSSGSPVYTRKGNLVGVVSFMNPDGSLEKERGWLCFRKAKYARQLLQKAIDRAS